MLLTNGVLMDHANYFEQFSIDYCYVETFALARSVGNAKLAPKHLTKIVIENIAVFGPPLMGYACAF